MITFFDRAEWKYRMGTSIKASADEMTLTAVQTRRGWKFDEELNLDLKV
jgi:hypothetical protein